MLKKIVTIVGKIADVVMTLLPLLGAWRAKVKAEKITTAIVQGVNYYWHVKKGDMKLKDALKEAARVSGIGDLAKKFVKKETIKFNSWLEKASKKYIK